MRPENQIKLAEELFAEISQWKFPADKFLNNYFRNNRFAGSKDRKVITSEIYRKIREFGDCPEWLKKYLPENSEAEIGALNSEAPTDLRVNTLKANRGEILRKIDGEKIESTPWGVRLNKRQALVLDGRCEVQDEGSQLVTLFTRAEPGETALDYCAGAGGKTLALAAMMNNKGKIVAYDNDEKKLLTLKNRAEKAGVKNLQISEPEGEFDLVVVDAPCSGTGTWRRSPDAKWRLSEEKLKNYITLQYDILNKAKEFVKSGGRLTYITCSILPKENEEQVEKFLKRNDNFKLDENVLQLSPYKTNTDGFFAVNLVRN